MKTQMNATKFPCRVFPDHYEIEITMTRFKRKIASVDTRLRNDESTDPRLDVGITTGHDDSRNLS